MFQAFLPAGNRLREFTGIILGDFVPVGVYTLVQCGIARRPGYWPWPWVGSPTVPSGMCKAEQTFRIWTNSRRRGND